MLSRTTLVTLAMILLFSSSACSLALTPTGQAQAGAATPNLQTLVVQALQQTFAPQTQVAQEVAQTLTALAANPPEFTLTPSTSPTPEFSFTPSMSPTLTFTFTPTTPRLTVSVGTYCRSGPGPGYDLLGVLPVGQGADVVGRNASGDTWVIKLPANPFVTCWLWGQYASLTGNWQALPVIDPPPSPTPTASFTLAYSEMATCPAAYVAFNLRIVNNGSTTWESNHVSISDHNSSQTNEITRDYFPRLTTCEPPNADQNLEPGEVGYTSIPFVPPVNGHTFDVTVRLCSKDGLKGICLEKTITFSP